MLTWRPVSSSITSRSEAISLCLQEGLIAVLPSGMPLWKCLMAIIWTSSNLYSSLEQNGPRPKTHTAHPFFASNIHSSL